jgi:hypothetical protein
VHLDGTKSFFSQPMLNMVGGTTTGFVGECTPDNFGIVWISTPLYEGSNVGTGSLTRGDTSGFYDSLTVGTNAGRDAGTECAGWVRRFWSFDTYANGSAGLFLTGTTTPVLARFLDLKYELSFFKKKGRKYLMSLDCFGDLTTAGIQLTRDRLKILLCRLSGYIPGDPSASLNNYYLDAVMPGNEVNDSLSAAGYTTGAAQGAKAAEIQRIVYTQFKTYSPNTIVCSPCWQGGEGTVMESFMAASAASAVVVQGDGGGIGKRGEEYTEALTFNPYAIADTIAEADADFTRSIIAQTIKGYIDPIVTGIANRRIAQPSFWAGREMPIWATEVNVSYDGSPLTLNSKFRFQYYSYPQRAKLIFSVLIGCFASGCSKVFLYAPDHQANPGPATIVSLTSGTDGVLRVTHGFPIFDGDRVDCQGNSLDGLSVIATLATSNGSAADYKGTLVSDSMTQGYAFRYLLGGWANVYEALQKSLEGWLETGFHVSGNGADPYQPQWRVDYGNVHRRVLGVETLIHG